MSQKKEAAAVRVEKLTKGRRIVERRRKCMITFQLSVGMLEIRLEFRISQEIKIDDFERQNFRGKGFYLCNLGL
jgi:hypothetical protein